MQSIQSAGSKLSQILGAGRCIGGTVSVFMRKELVVNWLLFILALCLIPFQVLSVPASAQGGLAFADGEWTGIMSFVASHEFYTISQTDARFAGEFTLTALGGEVDGTFEYEGGGVQETAFGTEGWFTGTTSGIIFGGAEMPVMSIELIDQIVNTVFQGQTLTQNSQVTPAMVGPMEIPVQITYASCERVEGDASQAFREGVTAAGGTPTVREQTWVAVRTGAVPDAAAEFQAQINDLNLDALILLDEARSGAAIDARAWGELIDRGAQLLAAIERAAECGGVAGTEHRSFVARWVSDLLGLVLDEPERFDMITVAQVLSLAYESGAIGSGAGSAEADELEADAIEEIEERLQDAIAADDSNALTIIAALAEQMGWRSIADRANDALRSLP